MSPVLRYISLVLALVLSVVNRPAEAQTISFSRLTTDNGLSQFAVNALYHDANGFIWVGTREGLNRYNGNGVKTFKLQKGDSTSLFCNTVLRITGDRDGGIFVLCTEGLARLDTYRDEFRTLIEGHVSAMYYDKEFYVARGGAIFRCDAASGALSPWYALDGLRGEITCMLRDTQGTMWIGTDRDGLFGLAADGTLSHPFDEANVASIYEDSTGRLWAGTWEKGLYTRPGGGEWTNWRSTPGGLLSDFVRCFVEDNRGDIWIGTFLGLNKLDTKSGKFSAYTADEKSPESLTHSSIWCLVKDPQGTIWAGTYFGGVNYFNPEYEIYTRYKAAPTPGEGLSSPIVGRMIEDRDSNIWVCTEGGGVNVLDPATGAIRWYCHTPGYNSISHNNVKAIRYDPKRHAMWIGTHLGGLNKLELSSGRFHHYRSDPADSTTIPSDIVRDVVLLGDSLVVATQNGVCLFDPRTGRATRLFSDSEQGRRIKLVAALAIDNRGTLWIAATGEGLFAYRFDTRKLTNYRHDPDNPHSLSSNNVNSIVQDRSGNLWIATSGTGLDRYRYESDDFENFDARNNGLSSDCIYDIRDSRTGKLLVITNEGFSRFDYATHRFDNHTRENGFPLTAINENAICLTHDGKIFLGGTQGMVSFAEADLDFTPKPYEIIPSQLTVNGQVVRAGDASGILTSTLCHTGRITLQPRHSVFSVEFATSNFIPANQGQIVYRLEGFSDEWTPTHGQRIITYTNLNPGLYTLVIRSADPSAKIPEARLEIEVLPPFYRTGWAWMIYILTAGGILWALVRTYRGRIRLQESLRYEQQHIRDVEELNQSKLRFFTNISHEFRTPLTLIIGQIEMLLQDQSFTPTIYNKVLRIYKNSLQLKELISELLDFRKQEQGHMKIRAAEQDLVAFLDENYLLFLEYTAYRRIRFRFDKRVESLLAWFDRAQMQKVINNLLSNAAKHTPEQGEIVLWVDCDDNRAQFGVTDTGSGISAEDLDRIFDRFYQAKDSLEVTQGTGIGLALTKGIVEMHHGKITASSTPGQGSSFTVTLPLGSEHFTSEQLVADLLPQETLSAEEPQSPEEPTPEKTENTWVREKLSQEKFAQEKQDDDQSAYRRIKGVRLLIVEDNDALRDMLVHLYQPYYEVLTASDGEEGWEKVLSEEPQIVLSDVVMPRLSGTELCRRIKSNIDTCHIPVVLLTARTAIEHNIEGLRTGADDYVTKPFNVALLLSRCNNLVNSRILLREKFSRQPGESALMLATNPIDKEFIDRAMATIERYMDDPEFNVNTFSREMGMARTNLFAKVKAITGSTPNEFISTIRLKKAASLLSNNPELNVSEIADRTGFSSARYFSKCFKIQFGVSPLSYRKGLSEDPSSDEDEASPASDNDE